MSSQPKQLPGMTDWQTQEIHTAIEEANAEHFATDAEVKVVMEKWNVHTV